MRRMLDPKEIGGGGDEKLYCHFIIVNPKDGGEIYFNYYSTNETKLTKATIVSAIKGKFLICQGYVKVNDSPKTPEYIYVSGGKLSTKWIDLTSLAGSIKEIEISYVEDIVSPVA